MISARRSGEKQPFIDELTDLQVAYGTDGRSHATWVKPPKSETANLTDYEPLMFSSFRVCCVRRGTIMESPVLITEQLILFVLFFACALPVWYYFKDDVSDLKGGKDEPSVRRFVSEQEGKMRVFAMIMTGLISFLLSFYTGITVARWWTMRTAGVGGIKAATVDLELILRQSVTCRDEEKKEDKEKKEKVLSAVRRYGQASLLLIFMWRRGQTKDDAELKQMLLDRNLLDEKECENLLQWNKHCLHETIWAWQAAIVNKLYQDGEIKSDQLYAMLLKKCLDGRQAVQVCHTHLAVRVPMQYVHLLGLLVKMHNVVVTVIMAVLFGAAVRNKQTILCIQLFARICILPFLFNAILLINCDLADPFNGGESDFPGDIYQANIGKDCQGMIGATDNVPDWLKLEDAP